MAKKIDWDESVLGGTIDQWGGAIARGIAELMRHRLREVLEDDPDREQVDIDGELQSKVLSDSATYSQQEQMQILALTVDVMVNTPADQQKMMKRAFATGFEAVEQMDEHDIADVKRRVTEWRSLVGKNSVKIKDGDKTLLEISFVKAAGNLKKTAAEFNRHRAAGNKVSQKTVSRALKKYGIGDNNTVAPDQY